MNATFSISTARPFTRYGPPDTRRLRVAPAFCVGDRAVARRTRAGRWRRQSRYIDAVSGGMTVCAASSAVVMRWVRTAWPRRCPAASQASRSALGGSAACGGRAWSMRRRPSCDSSRRTTALAARLPRSDAWRTRPNPEIRRVRRPYPSPQAGRCDANRR
jgi:hypothetical protein